MQGSDASFVTINFPKILHKKFSFILQEFPFMKNKDTAYIMNFPLFNYAFSHRKTMNTTKHVSWPFLLNAISK